MESLTILKGLKMTKITTNDCKKHIWVNFSIAGRNLLAANIKRISKKKTETGIERSFVFDYGFPDMLNYAQVSTNMEDSEITDIQFFIPREWESMAAQGMVTRRKLTKKICIAAAMPHIRKWLIDYCKQGHITQLDVDFLSKETSWGYMDSGYANTDDFEEALKYNEHSLCCSPCWLDDEDLPEGLTEELNDIGVNFSLNPDGTIKEFDMDQD
jgi:hypothetical protein